MADVLKGFVSGNFAYLAAWFLPSLVGAACFLTIITPDVKALSPYGWLASLDASGKLVFVIGAGVLLGVVLSTASTPIYRVLEGYALMPFANRFASHMQNQQRTLTQAFRAAQAANATGAAINLQLERVQKFPVDENEVQATRMGNAIRAFETYAWRQYQMDSQSLWESIWSVTPQSLRDEHDHARAGVDFCIAAIAVLFVFLLATVSSEIALWVESGQPHQVALLAGLLSPLALMRFFYLLAVPACFTWGFAVKAMVDIGRLPLAAALGLNMPATLQEERIMWHAVSRFIRESHPQLDWEGVDNFDRFRLGVSAPPPLQVG